MPKYSLADMPKDELVAFWKEFSELLKKYSAYFEPVPRFSKTEGSPYWSVGCDIVINKKIDIPEAEEKQADVTPDAVAS